MFKKLFLVHGILFVLLGLLLFASDSLSQASTIVHILYAFSSFLIFIGFWRFAVYLKSKFLHVLFVFVYYNYLFLVYVLFEIGKDTLGVPMTLKMVYPYFANFTLLTNLISFTTLIFVVLGYLIFLCVLMYLWNRLYKKAILRSSSRSFNRKRKVITLTVISVILILFFIKKDVLVQKFNEHKINEPYLTLLFFDEAFNRQKEKGEQNIVEKNRYKAQNGKNKNVILIIADALRPDFFQSDENLTPFIDSLLNSREFSAHDNMYATSAFSFNGISNILSSSRELYEHNFFIHDVLKKQGYEVNMILSGDMSNFWNLRDHIKTESVDFYSDGYENFKYGTSDNLNDDRQNILQPLDSLKPHSKPTFFYFHMMSVHQIGQHENSFKRFEPSSVDLSSKSFNDEALINDYKNRMMQLDSYVKSIYEKLDSKGYLYDAIIVLTSDHGQSLGEGGIYFHSKHINYESIKVPFISNISETFDPEKVTSQLDISPSILSSLDLEIPKTWQGVSVSDSIPKTVFQTQGDEYSMIWKENDKTLQLFYDKKKNLFKLLDISKDTKDKLNSIHQEFNSLKLDSLQRVLFSKFNLK